MSPLQADDESLEFVGLLTEHQRHLYSFIHSLLVNKHDVDEVLQETNLVLWRESSNFELGTNFRAWACTVALNQVRAFIKRRNRHPALFDEATMVAIARRQGETVDQLDRRADALANCISKLSPRKRLFLDQRYGLGLSVDEIAEKVGLGAAGVYKMLSRIRTTLHSCVDQTLLLKD
ncbi:sigma-70 family RNA polymerase sigma factor [Roseiconus lacunae]|uniref:Sigma-70 family RNA polymerase sigma factor n=1 Tax=Roseiconus lacunae TaxID=2605694 RepID=A0ABT7PF79_9BACT|nr:sigma-70 family RNA polymerase sigma factor [Roseiconus lacunae]MCD0462874.1 sigma-70 family RNA polymerase sigma factor [Roseiconus lacunae]MDM4014866.1 sigma-70 family RNA polymerase sigma factor [Roseiconus lacunae]WRQ50455.1 sigma-70 family RNA polymerase sigma factor [Stieleria sp. HD01]